jgi:hypothetical protein
LQVLFEDCCDVVLELLLAYTIQLSVFINEAVKSGFDKKVVLISDLNVVFQVTFGLFLTFTKSFRHKILVTLIFVLPFKV